MVKTIYSNGDLVGFNMIQWDFMGMYGDLMEYMLVLWDFMVVFFFYFMDCYGCLWFFYGSSMGFYGIIYSGLYAIIG